MIDFEDHFEPIKGQASSSQDTACPSLRKVLIKHGLIETGKICYSPRHLPVYFSNKCWPFFVHLIVLVLTWAGEIYGFQFQPVLVSVIGVIVTSEITLFVFLMAFADKKHHELFYAILVSTCTLGSANGVAKLTMKTVHGSLFKTYAIMGVEAFGALSLLAGVQPNEQVGVLHIFTASMSCSVTFTFQVNSRTNWVYA